MLIKFFSKQNYFSFGAPIFFGAFLMFFAELMVSKAILPHFGGSSSVWTTCLLFFQTFLLLGYIYAHLITKKFPQKKQASIHLVLLALSLFFIPILQNDFWQYDFFDSPGLNIFFLLTVNLGLPFFLLCATSPLFQFWFAKNKPNESPYKLYALSNAGSLAGLLVYPFLAEPLIGIKTQDFLWMLLYLLFFVFCLLCAFIFFKNPQKEFPPENSKADNFYFKEKIQIQAIILWILWPACASILLMSVTNLMTQDISVVPLLWVLPLSLYLLSFILAFEWDNLYCRSLLFFCAGLCVLLLAYQIYFGVKADALNQAAIFSFCLFVLCYVCHKEVALLKPNASSLTIFYIFIALGGALGGFFVSFAAPLIFNDYYEIFVGLILFCCLILFVSFKTKTKDFRYKISKSFIAALFAVFFVLIFILILKVWENKNNLFNARNFYGVIKISEEKKDDLNGGFFSLLNGRITHGMQFVSDDQKRIATTYYDANSGVGVLFSILHEKNKNGLNVGAIGLGCGTVSAYGRKIDYFKYYEINNNVIAAAEEFFSFLGGSLSRYDIVQGDARVSLEKEEPNNFDVLIIDAFTSDAIPLHLLTKEAFGVYIKHLKTNGVIAMHITNRHLDLQPIVFKVADYYGFNKALIMSESDEKSLAFKSDWILLSKNEELMANDLIKNNQAKITDFDKNQDLWTDDFSNLFKILK